jgi:FdhD protein
LETIETLETLAAAKGEATFCFSMQDSAASAQVSVDRFRDGTMARAADWVAAEEPLEIRVRGESVAVTMRTPGHDAELACGFLVSEGLLARREDVVEIAPCTTGAGNILNVFLRPDAAFDFERLKRHTFASSSCGLCGKASIESIHQQFAPVEKGSSVIAEVITGLPDKLRRAQETFGRTGGLHAAGLFKTNGDLLVAREDVGRHNAVDKVIGWAFLNREWPLQDAVLMVSGRASFEILQKALAARISVIAAVSAPSSLAVEFAIESQQTLIGFLRGGSFNVYSCPERIVVR